MSYVSAAPTDLATLFDAPGAAARAARGAAIGVEQGAAIAAECGHGHSGFGSRSLAQEGPAAPSPNPETHPIRSRIAPNVVSAVAAQMGGAFPLSYWNSVDSDLKCDGRHTLQDVTYSYKFRIRHPFG